MGFWRDLFGSPKDQGYGAQCVADPLAGFTGDEIQSAALDILWNAGDRVSTDPSWIGGTVERCDAALERIDRLRTKYSTYEPKRMRKAIEHWLDYYEREAREDRRDCETRKSRIELDEYDEKCKRERSRINDLHASLRGKQEGLHYSLTIPSHGNNVAGCQESHIASYPKASASRFGAGLTPMRTRNADSLRQNRVSDAEIRPRNITQIICGHCS